MLLFRYYLLAAFTVIVFWWPLNYLIGCFLYKRRVNRVTKNILSIDDYPIIGSALRFFGKNNEEMMDEINDISTKNQSPFMLWLGPKSFFFVDHPDDIQVVMNSKGCIEKSYLYRFFNGGLGFFSASAHVWKTQRKQLAPCYSSLVTWSFLPIFNQKANLMVRNVGRHIGKGNFDIMNYSSACALDIVCESVMGTEMHIQDGKNADYVVALNEWLSAIARRMCNVFMHPDIIYKQTNMYQEENDWYNRSKILPEKVIIQKTLEFNESNSNGNNDATLDDDYEDQAIGRPQNLINCLLKLKSQGAVTDEEIREHVNLVVFAGHDTSSFTIAHTILLLAMHPKADHLVMAELEEVFGDQPLDTDLTMKQVNQLVYLEQVIKESLRLFPVAPCLVRHCTEDTKLSNCTIPKGTEVLVSIISAQRRKDVWGMDADEFKPERFSRDECSKRSPYAFMAFSNGSRNCLGQRFAYISIKIILAKLFRKYQFSTHLRMDDIKFRMEVTLKPTKGVPVEVKQRIFN